MSREISLYTLELVVHIAQQTVVIIWISIEEIFYEFLIKSKMNRLKITFRYVMPLFDFSMQIFSRLKFGVC